MVHAVWNPQSEKNLSGIKIRKYFLEKFNFILLENLKEVEF